jgi:hypothetical protein
MSTREQCLRYSDECLALAQKTNDPHSRTRLLEMAQAWRELAERSKPEQRKPESE